MRERDAGKPKTHTGWILLPLEMWQSIAHRPRDAKKMAKNIVIDLNGGELRYGDKILMVDGGRYVT
jgi:hypothetical protein